MNMSLPIKPKYILMFLLVLLVVVSILAGYYESLYVNEHKKLLNMAKELQSCLSQQTTADSGTNK